MSDAVMGIRILECDPPEIPVPTFGMRRTTEDAPASASVLRRMWQWLQAKRQSQMDSKRLRICEQVSLGDKRFVAIVQVDCEKFLLGGSANSVSLLSKLEAEQTFSDVLQRKRGAVR